MSASTSKPNASRRNLLLVVGLLALGGLFWFGHPPVFAWAIGRGLEYLCNTKGLHFECGPITTRIDKPIVIEDIRICAAKDRPSKTSLDIARAEWTWNGVTGFFTNTGRAVRQVVLVKASGTLDLRMEAWAAENSPGTGSPAKTREDKDYSRWIPLDIDFDRVSVEVLTTNERWLIRDASAHFSENEAGKIAFGGLVLQCGGFSQSFLNLQGQTSWKGGTLGLYKMDLLSGVRIDSLLVDALVDDGPTFSLMASVFGGSLRGDMKFATSNRFWDLSLLASNIDIEAVPPLFGLSGKAAGRLQEAHLTFRGQPERPTDAAISLQLKASQFHWNNRGWESLAVASNLIHRRLVVTNFDLLQKDNRLHLNGEISLAEGWAEIAKAPFLLDVKADIKDLSSLAGLIGKPFDEVSGQMTATGSLSGRPDKIDGFLNLEAANVEYRSLPVNSLRVETVFRKSDVEVVRCEAHSRQDTVFAKATIGLAAPHQYSAEVDANLTELAGYIVPFRAAAANSITGGSMVIRWQGDGSSNAHSGAFDVQLGNFVSKFTPAGLTGKFAGTYSPLNMYFSRMEMDNGRLHLGARTTVAASGITVKDLELKAGNTTLLEGVGFFPINAFAVASGTDWRAAIDAEREAYIFADAPNDLNLPDILKLTGQDFPLQGRLKFQIEAGGPPAQLHADGTITACGLTMPGPSGALPESNLEARLTARDGVARLEGQVQSQGLSPLSLKAKSTFGLALTTPNTWRWINPDGEFEASLDFPRTDMSVLSSFVPILACFKGQVAGRLDLTQTFANPRFTGRIDIKNGALSASAPWPTVDKVEGGLAFDGSDMTVEQLHGEIGSAPFEIRGGAKFSSLANPSIDLTFHSEGVQLVRTTDGQADATIDLHATGDRSRTRIDGAIRLTDGVLGRRLAVRPTVVNLPEPAPVPPGFPSLTDGIPSPFSTWEISVDVSAATPFRTGNPIAYGEIIPDIRLVGTLGRPIPVGTIAIRNVPVTLPQGSLTLLDGRMDFLRGDPWVPHLNIRGTIVLPNHSVEAIAFGELSAGRLILHSDTFLTQQEIQSLLRRGDGPAVNNWSPAASRPVASLVNNLDSSAPITGRPLSLDLSSPATIRLLPWSPGSPDEFSLGNLTTGFTWKLE